MTLPVWTFKIIDMFTNRHKVRFMSIEAFRQLSGSFQYRKLMTSLGAFLSLSSNKFVYWWRQVEAFLYNL